MKPRWNPEGSGARVCSLEREPSWWRRHFQVWDDDQTCPGGIHGPQCSLLPKRTLESWPWDPRFQGFEGGGTLAVVGEWFCLQWRRCYLGRLQCQAGHRLGHLWPFGRLKVLGSCRTASWKLDKVLRQYWRRGHGTSNRPLGTVGTPPQGQWRHRSCRRKAWRRLPLLYSNQSINENLAEGSIFKLVLGKNIFLKIVISNGL